MDCKKPILVIYKKAEAQPKKMAKKAKAQKKSKWKKVWKKDSKKAMAQN
jgi:hypothetical protein